MEGDKTPQLQPVKLARAEICAGSLLLANSVLKLKTFAAFV